MKAIKLDEIKKIELSLLSYLISTCEKHNIDVFLTYGT